MKEHPIIFSEPMIRAIIAGKKTMTRRIYNGNPCRFAVGDHLWVREKYRIGAWDMDTGMVAVDYFDGADTTWREPFPDDYSGEKFNALAESISIELKNKGILPDEDGEYYWGKGESPLKWTPAMFMPRALSRITLEVTGVRRERLRDICFHDMLCEGAEGGESYDDARANFVRLWDSINGKKHGCDWDSNPHVWVIEFRRI